MLWILWSFDLGVGFCFLGGGLDVAEYWKEEGEGGREGGFGYGVWGMDGEVWIWGGGGEGLGMNGGREGRRV